MSYTKEAFEGLMNENIDLKLVNKELVEALEDLLGIGEGYNKDDNRDVEGDICWHCGRDYEGEEVLFCPADDCPGFKARQALIKAKGGQA